MRVFVYFEGFAVDAGIQSVCVCYGFSVQEVDDDAGIGHIHPPKLKIIMHVEKLEQGARRKDQEQKPASSISDIDRKEPKGQEFDNVFWGGGKWV